MRAFISHVHEEGGLGSVLKDWIDSSLLGPGNAFLSSDRGALPAGAKWLDTISAELSSAKVLVVLCSPLSLSRPWINFETGCAWSRQIPVIPLCHSGLTRAALPRPISDFQAIDLASAEACCTFMEALSHHCGVTHKPRLDYAAMWVEILGALGKTSGRAPTAGAASAPPRIDRPKEQTEILKALSFIDYSDVSTLVERTKFSRQLIQVHLDFLEDERLTSTHWQNGEQVFSINAKGRKELFRLGLVK